MAIGDFNLLFASVQKIEADEFLFWTTIQDWPNMKTDAREKLFDKMSRISRVDDNSKGRKKLSNKELAKILQGR